MSVFSPCSILLPKKDPKTWAVIACDQFTSEPAYWEEVARRCEGKPSAYHIIMPEAYLSGASMESEAQRRAEIMWSYLDGDVFCEYPASFVYVERRVTGGLLRRGIVGALDLEAYDYHPDATAPVRASERTVIDRLPPRERIRQSAPLESPHVLLLINDEHTPLFSCLATTPTKGQKLYDFDLAEDGGHISGRRVTAEDSARIESMVQKLSRADGVNLVVGDGNHSLAAAKNVWEKIKPTLSLSDRETHPARFALVELCSVYDEGIVFEPIHRIVFHGDPKAILASFTALPQGEDGYRVIWQSGKEKGTLSLVAPSFGALIKTVQDTLDLWEKQGCTIDYIHDDAALCALAWRDGAFALFLPAMPKKDLFLTVSRDGVFPKKSFSIGNARDKRYYLECRKIK